MSDPAHPPGTGVSPLAPGPVRAGLVLILVAVPLAYALVTSQAWEDFYIAFRHSVHLAEGHGLTYQQGERIQGFSSPLATLLLAAAYRLASGSETAALWAFRVLGIGGYVLGAWLLTEALVRRRAVRLPAAALLPAVIYLLDVKLAAFTVNGMETGLVLLFLAGSLARVARVHDGNGWPLGLWWAGALWTRPDSAVYIAAMALGAVLFFPAGRRTIRSLLRAGLVGVAAYAPWLAFAWLYYGSPVPQSVQAKMTHAGIGTIEGTLGALRRLPEVWRFLYLPPYSEYGAWTLLGPLTAMVAAAACLYWLLPRGNPLGRLASLTAFAGACYLALMPRVFPWYYPAVALCSLPALAALLSDVSEWVPDGWPRRLLPGVPVAAGLVLGTLWLDTAGTVRLVQEVVETGNRRPLGRWLREHVDPAERIYLECPGYIGYYSDRRMLDYPGLVSPSVVETRRIVGDDFTAVGRALAPEWLVLRSEEVAMFRLRQPSWLEANYAVARTFDVSATLRETVPPDAGILYDATFHVLRRRDGR